MRLSSYIKVDDALRFKQRHLFKIKKNHPAKGLFLLCTPRKGKELFEIIEAKYIDKRYAESYVIAISSNPEWIMEELIKIIDTLYNTKQLSYEQLKKE